MRGLAVLAVATIAVVDSKDGGRACAQLTPDTASQLEKDEDKPCAEAVVGLSVSGGRATSSAAYVTGAKVDLEGGDSAFLDESPGGWRISVRMPARAGRRSAL